MHWNSKWLVVAFVGLAAIGVSAPEASAQDLLTTRAVWAVVGSGGGLNRSNGAVSAQLIPGFTGQYEVIFNRPVTLCIFSGNIGQTGTGTSAPGEFTLVQRSGNANGVFVTTRNSAGAFANRPFHVEVDCD